MPEPTPHTFSAHETISRIVSSDTYLEQPRGRLQREAIAAAALKLAKYEKDQTGQSDEVHEVYRDNEELKNLIIGLLPSAYESQRELDEHQYQMHPSEKGSHLRNVIEYNHALRELVDQNPNTSMHDVTAFINEVAVTFYQDRVDIETVNEQARARLDGMRHEIAAEEMFWTLSNIVDVRSASREEDLRGIDVVVEWDDGTLEGFDIKSTQRGALEANMEAQQKSRTSHAVWTGLSWEDFGGKLRLSREEIKQHAGKFIRQLELLRDQQDVALSS